jgi:hypothetical protein
VSSGKETTGWELRSVDLNRHGSRRRHGRPNLLDSLNRREAIGEIWRNRLSAEIEVYFSCPTCKLLYLVKQVRSFEGNGGQIACVKCHTIVHSWFGIYDFRSWKPVTQGI